MRKLVSTILVAVLLVVIAGAATISQSQTESLDLAEIQAAHVERVIDGDTIEVSLNHIKQTVRLKGVDCPESVHPESSRNAPEGKAASSFTRSVCEGATVWLERDSVGDDKDQYGRLLRYVWLTKPDPARAYESDYVRENMLNGLLLDTDNANVYAWRNEQFTYRSAFEQIAKG